MVASTCRALRRNSFSVPICDIVVCAHNEAETVGSVLRACRSAKLANRVILVADHCTDSTATIGYSYGVTVRIEGGGDKGSAMATGLGGVATSTVVFLDGDVRGLLPEHVDALCGVEGNVQVVGTRDAPIRLLERWLRFPSVTGDRRVPTWIAHKADLYGSGWEAETRINLACKRNAIGTVYVSLKGVVNRSKIIQDPVGWGFEAVQVGSVMARHGGELWPVRSE